MLLGACGGSILAPVGKDPRVSDITQPDAARADRHIVRQGETLYSIAFSYGLNFREVANWNNIASPYVIYPGQHLVLVPNSTAKVQPSVTSGSSNATVQEDTTSSNGTQASATTVNQPDTENVATNNPIAAWEWPAKGTVITSFKRSGKKVSTSAVSSDNRFAPQLMEKSSTVEVD